MSKKPFMAHRWLLQSVYGKSFVRRALEIGRLSGNFSSGSLRPLTHKPRIQALPLRPIMPRMMNRREKTFMAEADSAKSTIPRTAVPAAPMPVHTA